MGTAAGYREVKAKAEGLLSIEVRQRARRGDLSEVGRVGTWAWTDTRTGEQRGSVGYAVEEDCVVLNFTQNTAEIRQVIPLLRTPCNYGNARQWFGCPKCGRRVALLYARAGGFNCRRCSGVAYTSQSEGFDLRVWRKQQKAEAKLAQYRQRPKGMHATTRDRLLTIISECESHRDQMIGALMTRYRHLF